MTTPYYADKLESLKQLFGAQEVRLLDDAVQIDARRFPLVDDVIVTGLESEWPPHVTSRLGARGGGDSGRADFAEDIQFTFGEEWKTFSAVLPDHEKLFEAYFDQVDLETLRDSRVCDLGCGMGRWSYFVATHCREIVLVDFSDAIFVARRNLAGCGNAIFVQADIRRLPFAPDCADFLFSLGVLHHLPTPALQEVVALRPYAPLLLVYLYYALDGRPWHFRAALRAATAIRSVLARVRSTAVRAGLTWMIALLIYRPMVGLGHLLSLIGLGKYVPLYEGYRGRSLSDIRLDAYDRFFTRIEQRVTRDQILTLRASFSRVDVAPTFPYWHFTCER